VTKKVAPKAKVSVVKRKVTKKAAAKSHKKAKKVKSNKASKKVVSKKAAKKSVKKSKTPHTKKLVQVSTSLYESAH